MLTKLFGPEQVQFFHMSGSILTVFSTRPKKATGNLKVRVALVGYKVNQVDIPLQLLSFEPCGKGQLCVGHIDMGPEHLQQLEDLLYSYAPRPDLGEEARRSARLATGFKAVSRDLEGYNCVSVDLSRHGVLLNCHGPVDPGRIIQLTIETEMASQPRLNLRGRVVICRDNDRARGYQVAIDFAGMSDLENEALEQFQQALEARSRGNLMQRQLGDGGEIARFAQEESG
ncbi:PilZ domain-containing protein [bacterium]|nr:PilZ domain-containing protein [bacterium]